VLRCWYRKQKRIVALYLDGKPRAIYWTYNVVNHVWFGNFIVAVITANTIALSMDYHNMPQVRPLFKNVCKAAVIIHAVVFVHFVILQLELKHILGVCTRAATGIAHTHTCTHFQIIARTYMQNSVTALDSKTSNDLSP
jgi:hypothetical protein